MTAEDRIAWIVAHRGEPKCDIFLSETAKKLDREVVEETLCHIWAGFYDAYPIAEITVVPVAKQCYAMKRERKLADHREHMRKLAEKRGVSNG